MYDYIEKLKSRPESHRRRFAFGVSGTITAIVFIIWASVIFPQTNRAIIAKSNPQMQAKQNEETPIGTLSNGVAQVYQAMKESFGNTKGESINIQNEYERMKNQVEQGEIEIVPNGNSMQR